MKTRINKIDCDWVNVKNKCRTTVNKEYTDNTPSEKFKQELLISEHSPIRLLNIDWSWEGIKSYVSVHLSRHKWECFVSTQRSDRTGVDRHTLPQDAPVNMDGSANVQNLIDTARKRLCYQASTDTRKAVEELKIAIGGEEIELAEVLVPNCVYRCGCPEFKTCGKWKKFVQECDVKITDTIQERYDKWNNYFKDNKW